MPSEPSQSESAGRGGRRPDRVAHSAALLVAMLATWLLLSGYFEAFLLTLGAMSCVLVVAIALRMDVVDRESFPIHLTYKLLTYWPWLLKEIWLAAVDVTKRVLSPRMDVSPVTFTVRAHQRTALGRTIFANSITLTPGTVSMSIDGDEILVHALTEAGRDAVIEGEMNRRACRFEGSVVPE